MKLLRRIDQIEAELNAFDQAQILDTILQMSNVSNSQLFHGNNSATTLDRGQSKELDPSAVKKEKMVLHFASGDVANQEARTSMKLSSKTPT